MDEGSLPDIKSNLLFSLLGIDSDNGSEFIAFYFLPFPIILVLWMGGFSGGRRF
jgi:hypothetical protein